MHGILASLFRLHDLNKDFPTFYVGMHSSSFFCDMLAMGCTQVAKSFEEAAILMSLPTVETMHT